jgi:hypothetical protein
MGRRDAICGYTHGGFGAHHASATQHCPEERHRRCLAFKEGGTALRGSAAPVLEVVACLSSCALDRRWAGRLHFYPSLNR